MRAGGGTGEARSADRTPNCKQRPSERSGSWFTIRSAPPSRHRPASFVLHEALGNRPWRRQSPHPILHEPRSGRIEQNTPTRWKRDKRLIMGTDKHTEYRESSDNSESEF